MLFAANRIRETARPHLNPLGVVDERGEDDDAENEEENEEHQLLGRGPEGLDQDLESGRVSGQLEEPQDSDDGEELPPPPSVATPPPPTNLGELFPLSLYYSVYNKKT